METSAAIVEALGALAQDHRLAAFRALVAAGPAGLAAGVLAGQVALAPSTLSFHLAHLSRAGLVTCRRDGRRLIYAADFAAMNALVGYLTENCCGGASCADGIDAPLTGAAVAEGNCCAPAAVAA